MNRREPDEHREAYDPPRMESTEGKVLRAEACAQCQEGFGDTAQGGNCLVQASTAS